MLIQDIIDLNTFANSSCKRNISSCLDPIRNDLVSRPMQMRNTVNDNDICSCSTNTSSHVVEQGYHINDFRFSSSILDHSSTFSLDRRQNRIDCCTDTNGVHVDVGSLERPAISRKLHTWTIHCHGCSHRFKGLQMQINGTWTKIASTRQANSCLTIAA